MSILDPHELQAAVRAMVECPRRLLGIRAAGAGTAGPCLPLKADAVSLANTLGSVETLYPRATRWEIVAADDTLRTAQPKNQALASALPPGAVVLRDPNVIATLGMLGSPNVARIPESVYQAIGNSVRRYVAIRAKDADAPAIPLTARRPDALAAALERAAWLYPEATDWEVIGADRLTPARASDYPGLTVPAGASLPDGPDPSVIATFSVPLPSAD